jgi:hypothetical protein
MRFMVIVKASKDSETGKMPSEKMLTAMGAFNEQLVKAGVMQAGEGLQASSKGARVKFSGSKRSVTKGPFALTNDLVAGFWIWKVKSLDEAIEWAKKCPNPHEGGDSELEIRQRWRILGRSLPCRRKCADAWEGLPSPATPPEIR